MNKSMLPILVAGMSREGLDDNAISRVLMPITGTTTPAQVRKIKALLSQEVIVINDVRVP